MERNAPAAVVLLGIIAVGAMSLASCGNSALLSSSATTRSTTGSADHRLDVTPLSGGPNTTFSMRFTAPASSGVTGRSRLGYTLGLAAPAGTACIGARSVQVPAAIKDEPVSVTLDPSRLGGRWCPGTYGARVVELVTPACSVRTMCPQFVRVVGTVATGTFRVERPS